MNAGEKCETGNCSQAEENPLDWQTFNPPLQSNAFGDRLLPSIVIEFCNRCRWLHRATWVQTELFLTFEDKQQTEEQPSAGKYSSSIGLKSIQLIPCNAPETGGRFRVWLYTNAADSPSAGEVHTYDSGKIHLLWDRKLKQGFPELKQLKQLVRDCISPLHDLGHSDRKAS